MKTIKIGVLLVLLSSSALAHNIGRIVITDGEADTKYEAVQIALQAAVESVNGVMLSSDTLIQIDNVVRDEISLASFGYISRYKEIVYSLSGEGRHYVKLESSVSTITPPTRTNVFSPSNLTSQQWNSFGVKQRTLHSQLEFLKERFSKADYVLKNGYRFSYGGFEITDVFPEKLKGHYFVDVTIDGRYWREYDLFLKKVSDYHDGEESYYSGLLGGQNPNGYKWYSIHERLRLPAAFEGVDISPLVVQLSLTGGNRSILLNRNSLVLSKVDKDIFTSLDVKLVDSTTAGKRFDFGSQLLVHTIPDLPSLDDEVALYKAALRKLDVRLPPRNKVGFTFLDIYEYFGLEKANSSLYVDQWFNNSAIIPPRSERFKLGLVGSTFYDSRILIQVPFEVADQNALLNASRSLQIKLQTRIKFSKNSTLIN